MKFNLRKNKAATIEQTSSQSPVEAKTKPHSSRKKNIIFWSVGGVLSLSIGVGIGYVLGGIFNQNGTGDYSNVDLSKYAVDYDGLTNRYNSLPADTDYSKQFTPCEMANVALNLFYKHSSWMTQGYGKTTYTMFGLSGDQQIRSTFMKNGDEYFEESLSKSDSGSIVDVRAAWRMYEKYDSGDESKVYRYSGTIKSNVSDAYFEEDNVTSYDREEYKTKSGRYLDGIPCIYIIHDDCLSDEKQDVTSKIETGVTKTSTGYTIDLELNPKITVKNYVVQMQATADLAGPPRFNFVHLTFKTDKKLNLITMTNYESYKATTKQGATSPLTAKVTTYFNTSGTNTIPEIGEQTVYDETK